MLLYLFSYPFLSSAAGPKDTVMEFVLEKTYNSKTGEGMPNL